MGTFLNLLPWWRPITAAIFVQFRVNCVLIFLPSMEVKLLEFSYFTPIASQPYDTGVWMKPYLLRCRMKTQIVVNHVLESSELFNWTPTVIACSAFWNSPPALRFTCQSTRVPFDKRRAIVTTATMGCVGPARTHDNWQRERGILRHNWGYPGQAWFVVVSRLRYLERHTLTYLRSHTRQTNAELIWRSNSPTAQYDGYQGGRYRLPVQLQHLELSSSFQLRYPLLSKHEHHLGWHCHNWQHDV